MLSVAVVWISNWWMGVIKELQVYHIRWKAVALTQLVGHLCLSNDVATFSNGASFLIVVSSSSIAVSIYRYHIIFDFGTTTDGTYLKTHTYTLENKRKIVCWFRQPNMRRVYLSNIVAITDLRAPSVPLPFKRYREKSMDWWRHRWDNRQILNSGTKIKHSSIKSIIFIAASQFIGEYPILFYDAIQVSFRHDARVNTSLISHHIIMEWMRNIPTFGTHVRMRKPHEVPIRLHCVCRCRYSHQYNQ